jgi:hypothetical protein
MVSKDIPIKKSSEKYRYTYLILKDLVLLYYDYKCICFINLLTGPLQGLIYGALIQGHSWKSGPLLKPMAVQL